MSRAPAASLLFVALLVAGCGSSTPSSAAISAGTGTPTAAAGGSSSAPSGTQPPASTAPADTASPAETPTASSPEIPSGGPSPSDAASASATASPCQPEGDNANFWPGIARSVTWDVYCAVLPKGWFVASGSYRLANGGKLVLSYKGPGGASLTLSEGAYCTDGSGCVPSGTDAGTAAFAALSGTLVTLDSGGYAIVAARGSSPSWMMVTSGLDRATTVAFGAALARVSG